MHKSREGFIRPYQNIFSLLYRLADGAIIGLLFHYLAKAYYVQSPEKLWIESLSLVIIYWVVAESLNLYRSWRYSELSKLLGLVCMSWLLAFIISFLIQLYLTKPIDYTFVSLGSWLIYTLLVLVFWRLALRIFLQSLRKRNFNTRSAIVIGSNSSGLDLAQQLQQHSELGIRFMGFYDDRRPERLQTNVSVKGTIDEALNIARDGAIDIVFIALPMAAEKRTSTLLERFSDSTATVHIVPNFFVYNLLHSQWHRVGNTLTLSIYDTPFYGINGWLKRLQDIIFGLILLAVSAIPMLAISIAIKLTSPGPILFIQDRYGLDRRKIRVYKFRSMTAMDNGPVIKQAKRDDHRITTIGRVIRTTSLDELPQLFNVIGGSMSLVGPRPHAVAHNETYRKMIRGYMLRHKVKPGMTGWAQVNGWRGETETLDKMENRIKCDLFYINRWSPWLDLKIIFLTVFNGTLFNKNTY